LAPNGSEREYRSKEKELLVDVYQEAGVFGRCLFAAEGYRFLFPIT